MRQPRLARFGVDALERLRRIRGAEAPAPNKLRQAATRVFASEDGKLLLEWMLNQTYGRSAPPEAEESALRENEARKRFFDQVLALAEDASETQNHTI